MRNVLPVAVWISSLKVNCNVGAGEKETPVVLFAGEYVETTGAVTSTKRELKFHAVLTVIAAEGLPNISVKAPASTNT